MTSTHKILINLAKNINLSRFPNVVTYNILFFLLFCIACANPSLEKNQNHQATTTVTDPLDSIDTQIPTNFPYTLDKPDKEFKLPNKLKEISGLGMDSTGTYLYAVQDEEGDIFVINKETGKVKDQIKFHKAGDYEGVEFANDLMYVVKSTGTLYEVHDLGKPTQKRTKHKFKLSKSSDVEGLGYDPVTNSLLLSCKGKAMRGEKAVFKKGVYEVHLDSMTMDSIPKYTVNLEDVKAFLKTNRAMEYFDKLVKVFSPEEEFIFGPSGLAIHPITQEIYIISAVGNVMVVLNRSNEIVHIQKLRKKVHAQPEGIVFDKDGTLYISNEGKNGKGTIAVFGYKG